VRVGGMDASANSKSGTGIGGTGESGSDSMSTNDTAKSGVCPRCSRRDWLLERLSARLDFRTRDLPRFWRLLELPDRELIEAIGGRRRDELHAAYAQYEPGSAHAGAGVQRMCRHNHAFPLRLRNNPLAPHTLCLRGGSDRLAEMLAEPVVAIVGTRRASDYGMETARGLARGLAAAGVTVASGLCDGIPVAVHLGALEANGKTLTVMAGGVEHCSPAWCAALYRRLRRVGCAISETPSHMRPRHWCVPARVRTLALLAQLVIVVEAEERPWELACASVAQMLDRKIAAVPGRVNSPVSRGTNALLVDGARLVRNPQDALDALYGADTREVPDTPTEASAKLDPRLRAILELVGAGRDTVAKLIADGARSADVELALVELELSGLIVRGDGGRYLPSVGLPYG
jgi:DNA processing protein